MSKKRKNEAMKEGKHMQSKSEGTKDMKQMQRSKGKGWDGKSRPVTDEYRDSWDRIFGKKEEEELKKSHEQSKRNRDERINDE